MGTYVIFTTSFSLSGAGSEAAGSFVGDFVSELSSDAPVIVVAPGDKRAVHEESGIVIYRYWSPAGRPLSTLKPTNPIEFFWILRVLISGFMASYHLWRDVKVIRFVFCFWVFPCALWAYFLSALSRCKYGTWALGSDIWVLSKIPIIKQLIMIFLKKSSLNYADGYDLCKEVESLSAGQCQFLASSRKLEYKAAVVPGGRCRLGFLGRWHPNKGVDILLDCLLNEPDSFWNNVESFKIAGGGGLEEDVRGAVSRMELAGRPISLLGFLDKPEVVEFLSGVDILIIPSRVESIPVILSDALQCGTCLLVTPAGDLGVVVDKYSCGRVASDISVEAISIEVNKMVSEDLRIYKKGIATALGVFSVEASVVNFISDVSNVKGLV